MRGCVETGWLDVLCGSPGVPAALVEGAGAPESVEVGVGGGAPAVPVVADGTVVPEGLPVGMSGVPPLTPRASAG